MLWQAVIRSAKVSSKSKQGRWRAGDDAGRRSIHSRYGSGEGPQAPLARKFQHSATRRTVPAFAGTAQISPHFEVQTTADHPSVVGARRHNMDATRRGDRRRGAGLELGSLHLVPQAFDLRADNTGEGIFESTSNRPADPRRRIAVLIAFTSPREIKSVGVVRISQREATGRVDEQTIERLAAAAERRVAEYVNASASYWEHRTV